MMRIVVVAAMLSVPFFSAAEGVTAKVSADTTSLRIGDQVKLRFDVTAPQGVSVKFPLWSDTLSGFEVAGKSRIDTTDNKNQTLTYSQSLLLTRFDSGYYVLPPVPFLHKDMKSAAYDTSYTEALLLTVTTLAVDTTRAIRDIKPPMDVPFTFRELLPWLIGAIALVALAWLLSRLLRRENKTVAAPAVRQPVVPAHVEALKALHALAEEKLWQQGLYKPYHTRLTDIVRIYIEKRYEVLAMEQTTDEILDQLGRRIPSELRRKLEDLLRLADLVKFAKVHPLPQENESSLALAREFVEETMPVVPAGAKEVPA